MIFQNHVFRNSIIGNVRQHHALADSPTIQASLLEWICTFETIHKHPQDIVEMIRSATLYQALMEIDPLMFPPLPTKLLSVDPNCLTLDSGRLRAIYKELLERMEKWYRTNLP